MNKVFATRDADAGIASGAREGVTSLERRAFKADAANEDGVVEVLPSQRRRLQTALSIALFVICVGGWELVVRAFNVPAMLVPPPSSVAVSLWDMGRTVAFWMHFGVTFFETMAGFGIGAVLALILGGLIGQFRLLEGTLYPYVVAFQAVPKVAIAPILVIWFGFGLTSKVVIAATIAFFPVLANTIVGLRAVPREQIEMLLSFTGSQWQVFRMAKVKQALPYIFAGLDISIMMAVIGAIVGEFVGSQAGLGYMIMQKNFAMDASGGFAILVVLSAMGIALHGLVQWVRRRVVFWVDETSDHGGH